MKVRSIDLKNYKRFKDVRLNFFSEGTGLTSNLVVLLGQNGSGKTSVLQAIAATLGTACGRIKSAASLNWPGFDLDLAGRSHDQATQIDVNIDFSKEELAATRAFYDAISAKDDALNTPPTQHSLVDLRLSDQKVIAREGVGAWSQFKGREYAKQVVSSQGTQVFDKVGSVFWYTEQRNAMSLTSEDPDRPLALTLDQLRDRLSKWTLKKLRTERDGAKNGSGRDLLGDLERMYQKAFPGRRFIGPEEKGKIDEVMDEPWYLMSDGIHEYEISEMSGAERAIFPILFDFANWKINHSVILIDEVELHLHPPMQQTFLNALQQLGENNQIILSTHSDYIYDIVPTSAIHRLDEV